jgi:hypothetical protein
MSSGCDASASTIMERAQGIVLAVLVALLSWGLIWVASVGMTRGEIYSGHP